MVKSIGRNADPDFTISSNPLMPSPTSQGDFRPEKFERKSTLRDYAIYAVLLVLLLGLIGGSAYYFTRPKPEKEKLRAKLDQTLGDVTLRDEKEKPEPPPLPELKNPKNLEGLLDDPAAGPKPSSPAGINGLPKTGSVSAYAGGRQNGVLLSDDPKLPQASPAFIAWAQSLKVSGVLQGAPAKAMLNGRMFRAGAIIEPEQGIVFVDVDGAQKRILLRDKTGAELRLSY